MPGRTALLLTGAAPARALPSDPAVLSVPGGCPCCAGALVLTRALAQLRRQAPDASRVLVSLGGRAHALAFADALQAPRLAADYRLSLIARVEAPDRPPRDLRDQPADWPAVVTLPLTALAGEDAEVSRWRGAEGGSVQGKGRHWTWRDEGARCLDRRALQIWFETRVQSGELERLELRCRTARAWYRGVWAGDGGAPVWGNCDWRLENRIDLTLREAGPSPFVGLWAPPLGDSCP